jgi:hypothetical protein
MLFNMNRLIFTILMLVLGCSSVQSQKPEGAVHKYRDVKLLQTPGDKRWAGSRCDVATLQNNGIANSGTIEVDFMEVIEEDIATGNNVVRVREDYNGNSSLDSTEGGLYKRNPWFDDQLNPILLVNSNQSNGILTIHAGEKPDYISHFWSHWVHCELNTRLKVRVSFRITGEIGFQFGLDYIPTNNGNLNDHSEAFYSKWYGDTSGRFDTITYPDYNTPVTFDRSQYGLYTNGKFFISKGIAEYFDAKTIEVKGDATGWNLKMMTLYGDNYEYETGMVQNQISKYCFLIEKGDYIPALFMESGANPLVYLEDVLANGSSPNDGYNFYTYPISVVKANTIQQP